MTATIFIVTFLMVVFLTTAIVEAFHALSAKERKADAK